MLFNLLIARYILTTTSKMSWAGFKKNVNRATTQVMMKTGHVERTSDRDYEVEERYERSNPVRQRLLTTT